MALESILRRRFTHQSDVWSYGVWQGRLGGGVDKEPRAWGAMLVEGGEQG